MCMSTKQNKKKKSFFMPTIRMNHIPPPPPDPLVAFHDEMRRFGLVMDPYVRKITDGPLSVKMDDDDDSYYFETENGKRIYFDHNMRGRVIDWTEDMQIGMYDPNYEPVRTEGKFYPGLKVNYNPRNWLYDPLKVTIIDGPFFKNDFLKYYICKFTVAGREFEDIVSESDLHEIPENLQKRLNKANALRKAANRHRRLKNTIKQKLSAITVPVKETRRNMRQRWFEMAGPKPTRNIELPNEVTRNISEYLYGNDKHSRNLTQYYEANANILSAEKVPRPTGEKLGGRRRTRRR